MIGRNLQLLGPVRVLSPDGDVPRFRSQRTMALLGYLVAEQRAVSRDTLAALFWPDETLSKGRGSLRRELHNLSQILPDCWEMDRLAVQFAPADHTAVDLFRFLEFEQTEQWTEAAALVRGDFLEGLYLDDNLEFETWLLGERERWRQRAENVLTRVVELHTRQAAYTAALDSARTLLQLTPWNEAIHRQVMLLLARTGQRGAAMKQYALCQTTLQEELGVAVSAETTALYERIKRSATFLMHNIPALTTPLIGRARELSQLEGWLDDPQVRLITITGAGGMGKTRLSLALAQGEAQAWENPAQSGVRFQDGVYFIPMVSLSDTAQIVSAIANVLHFTLQGQDSRTPEQQLFGYLQNKQLLLILDNLEHLLADIGLVSELLQAAPQVQIVATSRERLQLRGEQILTLDGLDYSDAATGQASRLFLETARRVQSDFPLANEDAIHLGRICALVEGMPLALELAASWVDMLSLPDIANEIEHSLDILETEARDMPARHRSIRAVFDTAWQRLSANEQIIYAQLSVFVGGFTREAAQTVSGASLRLLGRLVSQSLLQYDRENERYQMHELLRQYASDRLAANRDTNQAIRDAHLVYFRDLAEQANLALHGYEQQDWMKRLDQEQDNLRTAINWGQHHDPESAVRLASALYLYWFSRGQMRQARQQYERLLPLQPNLTELGRAWLLIAYTAIIWPQGELEQTEKLATETLRITEKIGDEAGIALSYLHLSTVASYLYNDPQEGQQMIELGLQQARRISVDSWYASVLLQGLSQHLLRQAKDEARSVLQESLHLCVERGDRLTALYVRHALVELAQRHSNLGDAFSLCRQILGDARDLGDVRVEAISLTQLGQMAFSRGKWLEAMTYLEDAIVLQKSNNFFLELADSLNSLGDACLAQGERQRAADSYRQAAAVAQRLASQEGMVNSLEGLAQLAWDTDPTADAPVRWLAAVTLWREQANLQRLPANQKRYEALLAQMRTHFSVERFTHLWNEDQALSLDEALAEALTIAHQSETLH
jgi:predicted ATPase/DNA-binding SARP family transcriptional activator